MSDWIALRSDWLAVHMVATSCGSKSHSSAMRIVAFSSSYDEVIAALSWQHLLLLTPSCNVPTVAEQLVNVVNRALRCLMMNLV